VLDPGGKLLYAMDQGQFADARHMSYQSIKEFFTKWEPKRQERARPSRFLSSATTDWVTQ
jgi:hypothetical protein